MNIYRSDKKGAGVGNYPDLTNLPQINGNTLTGNKTSAELGIITKSVDDLVNYYLKTETYSSDEIDTLIETVVATRFEVVQQLPTVDIKTNVIYLVPSQSSSQGHVKDEWINLDGTTAGWEQIGSTAIDLSNYVTTTALNATLTAYVTNTALQTALQSYVTSTDLATTLSDYVTSTDLEDYITETDLNTALEDYTTTEDLEDMLAEKQDVFQLASMPTPTADTPSGIYEYVGTTTANYTHGYFYEPKLVNGSYAWVNVKVQDGDTVQVSSLPNASQSLLGVIYQYTGSTTNDYINGFFYQCTEENSSYIWKNKPVQESGKAVQLDTFPTASSTYANQIYQYTGVSNNFYTNGYWYKCIEDNGSYSWVNVPVQDSENIQVETLPSPTVDTWKMVVQYIGATDAQNGLYHNYFYECVSDGEQNPTYSWQPTKVQKGGGHTIENASGTELTQRDVMKFGTGFDATDDSTNEKTVINVKTMTSADMDDVVTPVPSVAFVKQDVRVVSPRWLRFDPNNHKGLIIKGGTSIKKSGGGYKNYANNTYVDLTSDISTNGADYFVYLNSDDSIHAYTTKQSSGTYIGRFHTLCVDAGTITMTAPASPSSGLAVGGNYLVKGYKEDTDPDFYAFYNKEITAVSTGSKYDVITCQHPLSGYQAGDILPESVFCLTWHPECLVEDAMVYDKDMDICVDVYLQSGTGFNTRSAYNQTHTVNREAMNHLVDMRMVGKQLLSDAEFESASIGSNQQTNIQGSNDKGTVGGHVDTNGRRMISAIGCEEMCGYLWQWLRDLVGWTDGNWGTRDGQGSFGQEYGNPYVLLAGGAWYGGSHCGSRCRASSAVRSNVDSYGSGRGASRVSHVI